MNNTLPKKIIEEIKKQGIEPRPRWQFLLKRWVLWALAIFSTVLGGIAVAVIIFVIIDYDANVRAYLLQSTFENFLLAVPYVWLVFLAVLIGVTRYSIRHTKFGYRYTTARIIGAVLIGSIFLGIVLNALDIGEHVQDFLVETAPYYDELTYTSKDAWSHPEKGMLGGTVTAIISPEEFELNDFHKKNWRVNTSEIQGSNDSIIQEGVKIRIIGTQKNTFIFYAGQVFPWKNN